MLVYVYCRFGIGRFTTQAEIDYTADKCIEHVTRLREMRQVEIDMCLLQEGVKYLKGSISPCQRLAYCKFSTCPRTLKPCNVSKLALSIPLTFYQTTKF